MSTGAAPPPPPSRRRRSPNATWVQALERVAGIGREPGRTLPGVIDELAGRHAHRAALIGEHETLTFSQLAERSRRYARWALGLGLGHGDVVALIMPNRPDYLAIWLGLSRVGVTTALLNTNLTGAALAHCLGVVATGPLTVVAAPEHADALAAAAAAAALPIRLWLAGETGRPEPRLDHAAAGLCGAPLEPHEGRPALLSDRALCIYTSGTTSLPKAANVSHGRVMTWSHWFAGLLDTGPDDRLFDCLPMYHSIGGVVATGSALVGGGAVVIRERFSASRFWDDVVAQDCTLFQYIGELCRYLLQAPERPAEHAHRLRIAAGNGLRADVWTRFQDRFRIPQILEFYAATENTVSLYNVEGRVGAVGRTPPLLAHRSPAALVVLDDETGEPSRGADGLCLRPAVGDPGELLGRLETGRAMQTFEGYTSQEEGRRKILRDVFEPGDTWLRSGDLMRMDAQNFFHFADRLGDTFRWKGENVSTTEVEAALAAIPGIVEAAVYGVAVPGMEGRAGMAAIQPGAGFDRATLRAGLAVALPRYARPLFIRLVTGFERTETFKLKKRPLAAEGFDPGVIADPLFYDDATANAYLPLDGERHARICDGRHPP